MPKSPVLSEARISPDLASLAVPVSEVQLLPENPRRGNVAAVAASLATFGQRKPIVVRRSDRTVIAGNHTLLAAVSLGWTEIAVVWTDDDDATSKAFALADNRTAELGGYDEAALAALIAEVQEYDEALLAATGWEPDDLLQMLARLEPKALARTDPDDVPELAPAFTNAGDLWLLGPHRVLCADARDRAAVLEVMDGVPADLVWTDPPYGVDYVGKTADALTIENDRLDAGELEVFLRAALGNAATASRPGAAWFVCAPGGPLFLPFAIVLAELGIWRQTLTWLKDVFVMGRSDYHYRTEPILEGWQPGASPLVYGWTPGASHTPPPDRRQDSVWEIPRPKRSAEHPTMKPVELVARALRNHTGFGAVVLDVFGGSGTTLIAAEVESRRARLLELDPRYVDVICRRYEDHTGTVPVLAASGEERSFGG